METKLKCLSCSDAAGGRAEQSLVVVVLGMHRVETSALMRALRLIGVEADKDIEEHGDIAALNEELLGTVGHDWHEAMRRSAFLAVDPRIGELERRAVDVLGERLKYAACFAMTDPSMARLLPFWDAVFHSLHADVSYLVACRHPTHVARLLAEQEGLDLEHGHILWLGHKLACISGTSRNSRLVVEHDRLVADPAEQLQRLSRSLGLPYDPDVAESADFAAGCWEECGGRTRYGLPYLLSDGCPPTVLEMYGALSRLAADEVGFENPGVTVLFERIGRSFQGSDFQIGYLQAEELRAHHSLAVLQGALSEHERKLAELNSSMGERLADLQRLVAERDGYIAALLRSRSWRVTAPFRVLGYQVRRTGAAYRFGKTVLGAFGGGWPLLRKAASVVARDGWRGFRHRIGNTLAYYKSTGRVLPRTRFAQSTPTLDVIDLNRVAGGPLIGVIVPIFNPPAEMLEAAILSVRKQLYANWELILVDDRSSSPHVAEIMHRHAAADPRIRTCFREENGNISSALNTGLGMCSAEYFAILDHDDLLDDTTLYWVALALLEQPDIDYLYSDEDKVSRDGKEFYGAFFKPDWSPEYFLAMMYTCHLGVYRTSLVRELGGYRSEFDGAQDYDLTLRVVARAAKVVHIPRVLYHWRVWEQSTALSLETKPYAELRARRALEEYLLLQGENFCVGDGPLPGHHKVVFLHKGEPRVSIVIPTANREITIGGRTERHIDAVIQSIFEKSSYRNFEVLVVHNGNLSPEQIAALRSRGSVQLVAYDEKAFNLSRKINLGCSRARGEYLVIMNDDVRVITESWLEAMLGMAQREGVGVVGPKLLFPDDTIQHAGVVMLGGLPGHAYYRWPKDSEGYALGAKVDRNYIAVTGACAMTPARLFNEIGGFSSRYPLNYNDIDYCLKLHRLGYRAVYMAEVILYHYEGVSKEGGRSVGDTEISKFLEDWAGIYFHDPYYNRNLSQNVPYQFG